VCLVYTRWGSEEAFNDWVNSAAFQHGHKAHGAQGPVGTASELWSFDVIQQEGARSPDGPGAGDA
jgi:heme-degrading monooxygenase HmoA